MSVDDVLREAAPHVLGVLVRRHGRFDECEDAVQEALISAASSWTTDDMPANPTGWLVTTATRRLIESWRSDSARRRRELVHATQAVDAAGTGGPEVGDADDTLALLFLCCHPALTSTSQLALTLRALGGLTTAEIARALLVPEATVAQRISRAKARIRDSGAVFAEPTDEEWEQRLPTVLHVLYLIFNEGYAATSGDAVSRVELTGEAIRLARQLFRGRPGDGEVAGLLALMLLTDARRPARTRADGSLVALAEQDRSRWERPAIDEGIALITSTLRTAPIGPYQVQAAIAAVHDEAATAADTDWPQIVMLYGLLAAMSPSPIVTLNRIVATSMVDGPDAALRELDEVAGDPGLAGSHRVQAVRAHLLEKSGDPERARECYLAAARTTHSLPERGYLLRRAAAC